ncbi:right-handed parallel beta-helix repeat-containing protein [soil metagenome]
MNHPTNALTQITRRRSLQWAAGAALSAPTLTRAASPVVMKVGRNQTVKSLAAAAAQAKDGMRIEVDAGDYIADVATWPQSDLSLKAVGGRVRLIAGGQSSQGKGIFVTSGERIRIEGFDFSGAVVPDQNGAGIRLESGSLHLVDCSFKDNESGVLTSNDKNARLEVDDCEFGTIVRRAGQNHNCYVGAIGYLRVSGSYFHSGQLGHLLKSRAAVNHIFYNRLADGIGGEASYELDFPNGGQTLVVGNLIQQSSGTQNPHIVTFGEEGYTWPNQELELINNTLIDLRPSGGVYLRVAQGPAQVRVINNILAGNQTFSTDGHWEARNNFVVDLNVFVLAARGEYGLKLGAALRGKAVDPGQSGGLALLPTRQFLAPRGTLALAGPARHPGALQFP